jgi:hypothetical protein
VWSRSLSTGSSLSLSLSREANDYCPAVGADEREVIAGWSCISILHFGSLTRYAADDVEVLTLE